MQIFAIVIDYIANLEDVDAVRGEHLDYIQPFREKGVFLLSGPMEPRTGGFILTQGKDKDFVENIVKNDPFITKKVATYRVIEANITHCHEDLIVPIEANKEALENDQKH